jgi:hypothetical protein
VPLHPGGPTVRAACLAAVCTHCRVSRYARATWCRRPDGRPLKVWGAWRVTKQARASQSKPEQARASSPKPEQSKLAQACASPRAKGGQGRGTKLSRRAKPKGVAWKLSKFAQRGPFPSRGVQGARGQPVRHSLGKWGRRAHFGPQQVYPSAGVRHAWANGRLGPWTVPRYQQASSSHPLHAPSDFMLTFVMECQGPPQVV